MGIMLENMNVKTLYTLFKRSRINKKIVRGASEEHSGSKKGLIKGR